MKTSTFNWLKSTASSIILISLCFEGSAIAQEAESTKTEPPTQADALSKLDTITVTARRREETLQTVPISMSAFDASAFDRQQVADVKDLNLSSPNLTVVNNTGTTTGLQVYMRGVGQDNSSYNLESPIGVYVDDVFIGRQIGGLLDLVELERVEVLRGPQGTLYGRNSSGGALKYVTRKPETDASWAKLRGSFGSFEAVDIGGTANVPLVEDKLAVMVSYLSRDRDGFITAVNPDGTETGQHLNAVNQQSARIGFMWKPTPDWESYSTIDTFRDRSGPQTLTATDCSGLNGGFNGVQCPLTYGNAFQTLSNVPDVNNHVQYGLQTTNTFSGFDSVDIKSITAFRTFQDQLAIDFFATPGGGLPIEIKNSQNQFSQELQFASTSDGPFSWTTGAYFYREFISQDALFLGRLMNDEQTAISAAVYGDMSLKLADVFSISVGGRFTRDEKDLDRVNVNPVTQEPNFSTTGTYSSEKFTPKVGLEWEVTDNIFAYVNYGEGFKAGGFAETYPINIQGAQLALEPETVTSYEAGLKTTWFDNRVTLNGAYFDTEYAKLQQSVLDPVTDRFIVVSGDASFKGFDLEANARPFENTYIYGILGILEDEWLRPPPGVTTEYHLKHAPETHYKIGIEQTIPGNHGYDFVGTLNLMHTEDIHRNVANSQNIKSNPYTLIDARIALKDQDGRWTIALEGKNLGDEEYWEQGVSSFGRYYGLPRTVSLKLEFAFGNP
ncbi:TonB-dependent receptor [Hirschia litorea]|uniref:TonB-dependent receptor n=1 Tax=Hirschia litorea TaxID=1199156 RepID=A0ABW2IPN7_9PROT